MLLLLLGLFSCLEKPNNALDVDDDRDGFSEFDGDCDDTNPNAFPGAAELDSTDLCMVDNDGDGSDCCMKNPQGVFLDNGPYIFFMVFYVSNLDRCRCDPEKNKGNPLPNSPTKTGASNLCCQPVYNRTAHFKYYD